MTGHVAQSLTHDGDHVVGNIRCHGGVDRGDEPVLLVAVHLGQTPAVDAQQQRGGVAQGVAGQGGLAPQPLDHPDLLIAIAQGTHDGADLAHGVVHRLQGGAQHGAHRIQVRLRAGGQPFPGRGDLHPGGEELLDGQVVQIPADPGPLIEQRGHLLGVLGVGQLEGHGGLPRHELGDLQVLGGEGCRAGGAQQQHDPHAPPPVDHGGVEGRPELGQLGDHQVAVAPGVLQGVHDQAGLMGQGGQGPTLGREEGADQLPGVLAVGDLADPALPDAGQDEGGGVGVSDLADTVGDERQRVILLGAREQQRRQLLGDHHPLLAVTGLAVQAGVLHGDGCGLGQGQDGVGVRAGEAPRLVTQVEMSVDLAVKAQRGREQTAGLLTLDGTGEGRCPAQVVVDDHPGSLEPVEQGLRGGVRSAGGIGGAGHLGELIEGRRGHPAAQTGARARAGGIGREGAGRVNIHVRVVEHGDGSPRGTRDGAGRLHQTAQRVGDPQGTGEAQGRLDEGDSRLVQARLKGRHPAATGGDQLVGVDGIGKTPRRSGILRSRCHRLLGARRGAVKLLQGVLGHTGESKAVAESVCCTWGVGCRHCAQLVQLVPETWSCCLS